MNKIGRPFPDLSLQMTCLTVIQKKVYHKLKKMKRGGNLFLKMSLRVTTGRRVGQGDLGATTVVVNLLEEKLKIKLPFNGAKLHDIFTFSVDDTLRSPTQKLEK